MDLASKMFESSYKKNEVPPFGVLAETEGGYNTYFLTGAGGVLQSVLMGFGGLRITDQGIIADRTRLPAGWGGLEIRSKAKIVKGHQK